MWYYGDIKTYGHNYGGHNIDAQGHHRRRPHWSTQRHLARKWSLIDASPYLEVPVKPSYVDINIYIYIQLIDVISNFKITHKRSYIPTKKNGFLSKELVPPSSSLTQRRLPLGPLPISSTCQRVSWIDGPLETSSTDQQPNGSFCQV